MAEVTSSMVREARDLTGASFLDCKNALEEAGGDMDKAIDLLKIKGASRASKKIGRNTPEGLVTSYIHPGGKIGVMLELNCETDFVARNEEFSNLSKEITMQIAATGPLYTSRDEIPEEILKKEKEIITARAKEEGKPDKILEKIVQGGIEKFCKEVCLLEQDYIREPKTKISDLVSSAISKTGENIIVRRFTRFQLGES
ncbi:MAG: translation elongation factor Ts [Candidatus Mycalebacterium zealandia]|nr:MAG: translation elongation factor Ts [Candidatus Mycalebacterium zealandia]